MKKQKPFIRSGEADRRAIALHLGLQKLAEMPLIGVSFRDGTKIVVSDTSDPNCYAIVSVDSFLSLDLAEAKIKGGSFGDLMSSRKRPRPQVSHAEVDEGVRHFLAGDD